jgi:hypothetical protein
MSVVGWDTGGRLCSAVPARYVRIAVKKNYTSTGYVSAALWSFDVVSHQDVAVADVKSAV